ncbi:MAG: hypothetical protein O3B84_02025 [Chloroflexi bacterium]|nr:hypothetical protein [Chloroflexota bacterium]
MDPLKIALTNLGNSFATSTLYDFAKMKLNRGEVETPEELARAVAKEFQSLNATGARVVAQTLIVVFAEHGDLAIRDGKIYANKTPWMRSAPGTRFVFGDPAVTRTHRSSLDAARGSVIQESRD